ncbi:histone-lysine N-methyltransferase SETD1B-like isoform X2 [Cynara cardunculus var. scolymus]|uniref:histone-lysine N-methyltransferase SETD1B-like isoform X2 n=1 Tax=Cynara cardunculus var. scolymus TaxID=59895 RepID=UPI000D62BE60|nr:histone-lysine N-methyltransferase SETD1B-like isoform X2 [Cynara cardunculus var. scolymus]
MNFFQSVFSDDPDPSSPEPQSQNPESIPPNPSATIPAIASAWTFGSGLMKTLASKSESVIETYRRDLEEFSSGIKKETAVIREAAARAVKDLPTSLEAGAGLAQESLESVGQAIDDLGSTVTEIIAQGEEDEELSWDVDEDDYEENAESDLKIEEKESVEDSEKEGKKLDDEKVESRKGNQTELEVDNMEAKSDVKTASEGKTDRDSDISVVSSQPSPEEDGWDEIEDIGSSDESKDKVVSHGSPKRAELHKRLSVAQEEEEDLTWDIEDDDEPVQA